MGTSDFKKKHTSQKRKSSWRNAACVHRAVQTMLYIHAEGQMYLFCVTCTVTLLNALQINVVTEYFH